MQGFSRIVSVAIGNLISASIIGGTVVVGVNRREARRNIIGLSMLHSVVEECLKDSEKFFTKQDRQDISSQIETQKLWLAQPVYKQLQGPPMPL